MEAFGHYRLEALLGQGGMGQVYRAYDTVRQRTVALKRLKPGISADDEYQERFRREARMTARLSSPHVIPIHDFGELEGRLYLDMRLVDGVDLGRLLRDGPLPAARAVEIVRQVADALDSAHAEDMVHRDVKPSNVLVTEHRGHDFAYLVDFGIVRSVGQNTESSLTATGLAVGTLDYMAPELFTGAEVDRRVDVYALGCLLHQTLTGHPPFHGEGPALMFAHLHSPPPRPSAERPDLPPGLDAVVATALAKDPAARYPTAGDLAAAALDAVGSVAAAGRAQDAGPPIPQDRTAPLPPHDYANVPPTTIGPPQSGPPPLIPPTRPPRRIGRAVLIGVLTVVLLAGAAAVGWFVRPTASETRVPPTVMPQTMQTSTPVTPPPSTPGVAPSTPATGTPATGTPTDLATVFPDIGRANISCTPADVQGTTNKKGTTPTQMLDCRYPGHPDVSVLYARWPSATESVTWIGDLRAAYPAVEQYKTWSLRDPNTGQDVVQGPYFGGTLKGPNDVQLIGAYNRIPFTFAVQAKTLQEANAVYSLMDLSPW